MTDLPEAADGGHRVLLDSLQGVRVAFWTCPNEDHKYVTWTGDVASCDSCGMTSVMTARLIRGAAAYERERIASAIPADTIDGLADYLIRVGAEFHGPAAVPDLPARLKRLAGLLRVPDAEA